MEDYALSFWIYIGVMSMFVGGAVKKILASHISAIPSLVAWLAATVLLERLYTLCLPAFLVLAGLCAACCLLSSRQSTNLAASLPTEGKAVFITGKAAAVLGVGWLDGWWGCKLNHQGLAGVGREGENLYLYLPNMTKLPPFGSRM